MNQNVHFKEGAEYGSEWKIAIFIILMQYHLDTAKTLLESDLFNRKVTFVEWVGY